MECKSPRWLAVGDWNDDRNRLDFHYGILDASSVRTPETDFVSTGVGVVEKIQKIMQHRGYEEAFLRSVHKAAPNRLTEGSKIRSRDGHEIRDTVRSLVGQHELENIDLGGQFAVREPIDTDFCMGISHEMCHPEIRYFVEGGEILGATLDADAIQHTTCDQTYTHLEKVLSSATCPDGAAQIVADTYVEHDVRLPLTVDFIMGTDGKWYCTEVHLDSVYKHDGEWWPTCGRGSCHLCDPALIHGPALRLVE